jgi:hypothetical protein
MAAKTMAFREIGTLLIEVHGTQEVTNEEWNEFLRTARKAALQGCKNVLVVTAGWGPNAVQRNAARDAVGDLDVRAAVVSDAPLIRGIVTALSWLKPTIRSFPNKNGAGILDAMAHLGVDAASADRILVEVRHMQREVA